MIKAYAEPKGHFVEVKLTNEELSDPLLVFSEIYSILEDIVKQIDNQIGGKTPLSVFCQGMADVAKYEDINIEYQLCDYMMWFSEESIYRYHKVYNVFELEGQNGHKVV